MLRFTSKVIYKRLRQSSHKIVGKYFLIVYILDNEIVTSRAGITVSKKIGNAVQRNKVKRRVRAFLREYSPYDDSNLLLNIIALPSCVCADWKSIKIDLTQSIDKIFLY